MNSLQTLTKIEEDRTFYNSIYEASTFLTPKPDNIQGKKKKKTKNLMHIDGKKVNKIVTI